MNAVQLFTQTRFNNKKHLNNSRIPRNIILNRTKQNEYYQFNLMKA